MEQWIVFNLQLLVAALVMRGVGAWLFNLQHPVKRQ